MFLLMIGVINTFKAKFKKTFKGAENDWRVIRYADVLLMMADAKGNS